MPMHDRPPAANTTPPNGREPVLATTAYPAISEPAASGAVGSARTACTLAPGDQPALQRVADEVGAGGERELLLDVRAVRLDRAHGQVQLLRDLRVGVPKGDQAQHVELALGEVVRRPGERLGRDARAQPRVQVALADRRAAHR